MNKWPDVREEDLHAFVDGELDEPERARIGAIVEGNTDLRERVALYRADKARLAALYGVGMSEPLPMEWIASIERATARPRWRTHALGISALAASLVLIICGVIAYRELANPLRDDIVADALAARAGTIHPVSVVPADAAKVAAEARVMTAALDARAKAPDLSRLGYRLAGINVYSEPNRAFELRYARGREIFTLYLRRSPGAPRFDQFKEDGLRVCIWQDDVLAMVMAGTMSVAEMQRLASLAYTGLAS